MLRNQVLHAWTNCKNKIQNNWKEGKVLTFRPMVQPIPASEEIKNYVRIIKNHEAEIREFYRERTHFTKLESKLEKIRNLLADGETEKLKKLFKQGQI